MITGQRMGLAHSGSERSDIGLELEYLLISPSTWPSILDDALLTNAAEVKMTSLSVTYSAQGIFFVSNEKLELYQRMQILLVQVMVGGAHFPRK